MRSYTQIAIPHLALALAAGCFPRDLPDQFYELTAALESDASSSGSGGDDVTGSSTVTGNVTTGGGDDTWTGGADGDQPPEIKGITINGELCGDGNTCSLDAAGPLAIAIAARDDFAVKRITLTIGSEIEELDEGIYSEKAWHFEHTRVITSILDLPARGPGNKLTIRAVAHDSADQQSEAKSVDLGINMPAGGLNAWERGDVDGVAQAVAVAEDGLVVIGRTGNTTTSQILLRKYNVEGDEQWEMRFPDKPGGESTGYGVVVDRQGVIYATGAIRATHLGDKHLWILRYDPGVDNNDALTTYRYDDQPSEGRAILLDPHEKFVYVVGQEINTWHGYGDALIMRRHADDINRSAGGVYASKPMDLVVDPVKHSVFRSATFVGEDDLVAVGTVWDEDMQSKGLFVRLGANGLLAEEWEMSSIADHHEMFASVAVDPEGRVYSTGRRLVGDSESAMWIARHDKDGMISKEFSGLRCGVDGCQIAIDPAGRLVIGGAELKSGGDDAAVHIRKVGALDLSGIWEYASGAEFWERRCLGLAIDPSGYVYGVGFAAKIGGSPSWWLAKLNP